MSEQTDPPGVSESTAGEREHWARIGADYGRELTEQDAVAASTGTSEDVEALAVILADWLDVRSDDTPRDTARHILTSDWLAAREAAARAEAWEAAADLADTQIVLWSGVPGLHPTEPEPHPAAIAAAGARRTLTVLRSRMSEAFDERIAREGR